MERLNRIAKDMMTDIKKGRYPLYGITALAGCRPLHVFREGVERPFAQGTVLTKDQEDVMRNQDPVGGWW